jgi:predicted ester cyclase
MSATEPKAIAEQLIQTFNDRDFARLADLFSDDYVNHNPPPFPGFGGDKESQVSIIRGFAEGVPDARARIDHLVAKGDVVVIHDIVTGRHEGDFFGFPATGNDVRAEFIHIFRVADEQLVERWGLMDAMSIMQQIGAMPTPDQATA